MLGDGAYSNTGRIVPHGKRLGRPLLAAAKATRGMRDCRHYGDGLHPAAQAVAHMHYLTKPGISQRSSAAVPLLRLFDVVLYAALLLPCSPGESFTISLPFCGLPLR